MIWVFGSEEEYVPQSGGRLCLQFTQAIQQQQTEEIQQVLSKLSENPEIHPFGKILISTLQSILSGSRDPALANNPELMYMDAAEIRYLLETLSS